MTTVIAFLVTIGILILVHEWGHYRVAVACGVKVLRFSLGFGKVIWQKQKGETEFVVSMLPLGGYVRMLDEREGPVADDEKHRAFNRLPLLKRAAVVVAGPLANLILAVALYAVTFWMGTDEPKPIIGAPVAQSLTARAGLQAGDWIRAVQQDGGESWTDIDTMSELRWALMDNALAGKAVRLRVQDRQGRNEHEIKLPLAEGVSAAEVDGQLLQKLGLMSPYSEPVLGALTADGPAQRSGLQMGDRVLTVDGKPVLDAASLRQTIRASLVNGEIAAQAWQVERAGAIMNFTVQPRLVNDAKGDHARIDAMIGSPVAMITVRHGFFEGISRGITRTWEVSALSLSMLGKMLIGQASLKNLSGPITIADFAGQTAQLGLSYYLGFLALVSVSLGVLNLLPLPMLDGGHLMYYLFEGVTGRPVSTAWMERLQRGGLGLMLVMMSLAIYNDVARLLGLQ